MKIIILFLILSIFLIADSIKTDLTVTFYGLTLEQAAELEVKINEEFKEYSKTISIPETSKQTMWDIWRLQDIDDNNGYLNVPMLYGE